MNLDPPVVDLTNPCYSPTLNGDAYLAGLASELSNPPRSRDQYLASFLARLLYPARNGDTEFAGWPLKHPHSTFCDELLSQRSEDSSGSGLRHLKRIHSTIASPADIIPVKRDSALLYGFEDFFHDSNAQSFKRRRLSDPCDFSHAPSSTSATFSDLRASSKHAPSSNLSINQSSFEVTKADKFPQYHLAGIGVDGSSSALDIFPDEERGTPELELDVTPGYDDSDENTSEWILKGAYMTYGFAMLLGFGVVLDSRGSCPWRRSPCRYFAFTEKKVLYRHRAACSSSRRLGTRIQTARQA